MTARKIKDILDQVHVSKGKQFEMPSEEDIRLYKRTELTLKVTIFLAGLALGATAVILGQFYQQNYGEISPVARANITSMLTTAEYRGYSRDKVRMRMLEIAGVARLEDMRNAHYEKVLPFLLGLNDSEEIESLLPDLVIESRRNIQSSNAPSITDGEGRD